MIESDTNKPTRSRDRKRDRKLGDEWADWKGDISSGQTEVNETLVTFSVLAAIVIVTFFGAVALGWYLVKPRISQLSPRITSLIEWSVIFFLAASIILALIEGVWVMKFRKSIFPYRMIERFLLSILPKAVWLGGKIGLSKDRVGNSFIKVHNFITKIHADKVNPERLLILLPRCLKKEARDRLLNMTNGDAVKILTVSGGEEARQAIKQCSPTLILALACERDLMSGIKDVAEMIPVLALANKRPEGPCKNTEFSTDELGEIMKFISDIKKRSRN